MSAAEPASGNESQKDAHKMERDGRQVRRFVLTASFSNWTDTYLCHRTVSAIPVIAGSWYKPEAVEVSKRNVPLSLHPAALGVSAVNDQILFFRSDRLLEQVSIALVGKYTKLSDSYTSVIKALEHSALAINHKLEVKVCKPVFFFVFF